MSLDFDHAELCGVLDLLKLIKEKACDSSTQGSHGVIKELFEELKQKNADSCTHMKTFAAKLELLHHKG